VTNRAFRFGVLAERVRTRRELVETARRAEDAGYATFLLRDHFIEPPFGHQFAPFPALATVAACTERLRIGTMVACNDYRHPVMLVKEAATLDVLSEGRFELGLGAGFMQEEYERAGIPFDRPGRRVDRLIESVAVLKKLFAGEPATFDGEHYAVDGLDAFPMPVQRPHPPLLIAGAGRRMLDLAAREADIVGLQTVSTAGGVLAIDPWSRLAGKVDEQVVWLRQRAGARWPDIEISAVVTLIVTDDREAAAERFIQGAGWSDVTVEDVLAIPTLFVGTKEEIVDLMVERRDRYGLSYLIVPDSQMAVTASILPSLATAS